MDLVRCNWIIFKLNYVIIILFNYINMYIGILIIICMIFFEMILVLRNILNIVIKCLIVFADILFFVFLWIMKDLIGLIFMFVWIFFFEMCMKIEKKFIFKSVF